MPWLALLGMPSVLQAASTRSSCQHAIGSQPSAEVPSRRKDRRRLVHAFTKASPKEVHRVASYATRRSCAYVQYIARSSSPFAQYIRKQFAARARDLQQKWH